MTSSPPPPFTFSIPFKISLPSRVFCLLVVLRLMRLARELKTAVSFPAPPIKRSLPKPPINVSLPFPPFRKSLPSPPLR